MLPVDFGKELLDAAQRFSIAKKLAPGLSSFGPIAM
jgi:hypothetical protein